MRLKTILSQLFLPFDTTLVLYKQYFKLVTKFKNVSANKKGSLNKKVNFLYFILFCSSARAFAFGLLPVNLFDEIFRYKYVDFVFIVLGQRLVPGAHLGAGFLGFLGAYFLFVTFVNVPCSFLVHLNQVLFFDSMFSFEKINKGEKHHKIISMKKKAPRQIVTLMLTLNATKGFLFIVGECCY